MFWKIAAVLLAASPASAGSTYGPWSPTQMQAIQHAAAVLAASAVCRNIAPFSENRAAHVGFAETALREAGLPAEELLAAFVTKLGEPNPIAPEPGADFVCRVILGEIS